MKTSNVGIELIQKYEGCMLTAYRCPAGVLTIGYGHTGKVDGQEIYRGMKITKAKAIELLKSDLSKFEKHVMKYDSIYHYNQNQFDALVSFSFNIGSIDQLTANGTRSISQISSKIPAYNKAGGKVLAGLVKRRNEEKLLFDSSISITTQEPSVGTTYTVVNGDTLSGIGHKVGMNWRKIAEINSIQSPYTIHPGQVLKLTETTANNNGSKFPYKIIVATEKDNLNVRSGPGLNYKKVKSLKKGSENSIIEEDNGWGRLEDKSGWVCLEYIKRI